MKKLLVFLFAVFMCGARAATETTKWYIDGNLYATTSCESGGDITMPTEPERFGSIFQGWMPAVYDMSTLDTSINGTSSTQTGTKWRTIFSYGTVYGEALCSSTSNAEWYTNVPLNTEQGSGVNCYCRVTEFIPTDSTIVYGPAVSPWAYLSNPSNCGGSCPMLCATNVKNIATLRAKLFGVQ